jgi:hypothetical protein
MCSTREFIKMQEELYQKIRSLDEDIELETIVLHIKNTLIQHFYLFVNRAHEIAVYACNEIITTNAVKTMFPEHFKDLKEK